MVTNYNTFDTSIGRLSIEPTLKHATAYGGIIPLLDYLKKIQLTNHLEEFLPIRKQGGLFPLASASTALILGRLIGIERISHFEDIENETLLKRFFGWDKLPDYTTYYNDLQRFEKVEHVEALKETNERLTERVLSKRNRVILDFDSSVNTVFGHQEGAEVGYNPVHPGKKSVHPLYAFDGNSRLCLYAKLRSGKTYTSDGMIEAAEEALNHVRSGAIIMARFDKGFPNEKHLLYFEDYRDPDTDFPKEIPYVGKLKLYNNLVKKGLKKDGTVFMKGLKLLSGQRLITKHKRSQNHDVSF